MNGNLNCRLPVVFFLVCLIFMSGCSSGVADAKKTWVGADFAAWRGKAGWDVVGDVMLNDANHALFVTKPGSGIIVNGPVGKARDLISKEEFGDVHIELEFMISKGSNSGVYLQGQYEIQIADSRDWKKIPYPGAECGGIYERWDENRAPKGYEGYSTLVNAAKGPGEWQKMDIVFHAAEFDADGRKIANARVDKVILNGKVIHKNIELKGPTRGSMAEKDIPKGPLRLQGDHGPVAYRNIRIRPLN